MNADTRPLQDLQTSFGQVIGQVQQSGKPVVLTAPGQPSLVLMQASQYDEQLQAFQLAQLLAAGERDVAAGRVRPASAFFTELRGRDEARPSPPGCGG